MSSFRSHSILPVNPLFEDPFKLPELLIHGSNENMEVANAIPDFDPELCSSAWEVVQGQGLIPNRDELAPFGDLGNLIAALQLKLQLYSSLRPVNGFAIEPREYLRLSLNFGPPFANWLKKMRSWAFIKTFRSRALKSHDELEKEVTESMFYSSVKVQDKYDYDSFLHERNLIPFKETANDFPFSFLPVEEDTEWLELFRLAARSMLERLSEISIKEATNEDKAHWISDSITVDGNGGPMINRTLMRNLAMEGSIESETSNDNSPFRFKRSVVMVEPANVRDTWQCDLRTLFGVKRISHVVRQVLDHIEYSAMAKPVTAVKRRRKLRVPDCTYMMFDYRKCGLTVNRSLIKILKEELVRTFPGKGFEEISRYEDLVVSVGEREVKPPRGIGLGNGNELITLIQCVFGYIAERKFFTSSVFFNDDGVIALTDDDYQVNTFVYLTTLMSKCGMILNLKKTLISWGNVFCEEYFSAEEKVDYTKKQAYIIPFASVFLKPTIAKAKIAFHELSRLLIGRHVDTTNVLKSLIKFRGYEFGPFEASLPFEFGGWRHYGDTSVSECIRYCFSWDDYVPVEDRGFIPYIRRWIKYLVDTERVARMLTLKGKITYKKFVSNPYYNGWLAFPQSESEIEKLSVLGFPSLAETIADLDKLYNVRGLKNAKPHLKEGIERKFSEYRRRVFRAFKAGQAIRPTLTSTPGEIRNILEYLRGGEVMPSMYMIPDELIHSDYEFSDYIPTKRFISPIVEYGERSSLRDLVVLQTCIFYKRLYRGTKLTSGRYFIGQAKSRSIISDVQLKREPGDRRLPDWIYLFYPKKSYAPMLYEMKHRGKFPKFYGDFMGNSGTHLDELRRPIKYIFPNQYTSYLALCKRRNKNDILSILTAKDYESESEFAIGLKVLNRLLDEEDKVEPVERKWRVDFSEELATLQGDKRFARELVSTEETLDELVEDYEFQGGFASDGDDYSPLPSDDGDDDVDTEIDVDRGFLASVTKQEEDFD